MNQLNAWWHRIPKVVRKPLIFLAGSAVVLTGLAMLVLPGPGWAAIFLGFAILATEFMFAEKARDWLAAQLKRALDACKRILKQLANRKP